MAFIVTEELLGDGGRYQSPLTNYLYNYDPDKDITVSNSMLTIA